MYTWICTAGNGVMLRMGLHRKGENYCTHALMTWRKTGLHRKGENYSTHALMTWRKTDINA